MIEPNLLLAERLLMGSDKFTVTSDALNRPNIQALREIQFHSMPSAWADWGSNSHLPNAYREGR
jgi:hypothetical protein